MALKIAPTSLQCSQQVLPHSFTSPKACSTSLIHRCTKRDPHIICRFVLPGTSASTALFKSRSLDKPIPRGHTLKRACSLNFHGFSDEDLSERIDELVQSCGKSGEGKDHEQHKSNSFQASLLPSKLERLEPFMLGIQPQSPEWREREELMRASFKKTANSVDLPMSLSMIKEKSLVQEPFGGSGESNCCPVQKAFCSMVFIILELQSHALKMRGVVSYDDLKVIIARVHREMNVSFVWLFQQVFSLTPSLMVYMMILLANFSVYSLAQNAGIEDHSLSSSFNEATEMVSGNEGRNQNQIGPAAMKSYSGKSNGGGIGDVVRYLGRSSHRIQHFGHLPFVEDYRVGEKELWNSLMDEAARMRAESGSEVFSQEMIQSFVSPISVQIEPDNYVEYFRTDLLYQMGLAQEPNNSLLLCNYARFLHLVACDYDRAEECFNRAIQVEPLDAEALSQYANFLWIVRKDLWGAEERYLQALAAEPGNPFHASRYANFLWSTGGEETCFPLSTSKNNSMF